MLHRHKPLSSVDPERLFLALTKRIEIRGRCIQREPKGGPHDLCLEDQAKDHVGWQFEQHRLRLSGRRVLY
jgi:hypothetical protein